MEETLQVILMLMADDEDESDSSCSSSSEDEEELFILYNATREEKNHIPKVQGYAELVPLFTDSTFKSNFRLERRTVQFIENEIANRIENTAGVGRSSVPARKQILMVLWLLATPECFRSIAEQFKVTKSTLHESCVRTLKAIASLSSTCIRWPSRALMSDIADEFKKKCKLPGVIGCVNCTYIPIKAPQQYADSYVNRKGVHAIILQGVADQNCMFIDTYVGEAGSVHDARVYRRSCLGREMVQHIPRNFHLVGDSAYTLNHNLLTPFKDNGHLSDKQKKFNCCLSKTHAIVKQTFARLKGRFRRLKYLDMRKTALIPMMVTACCVLHNICQLHHDVTDEDYDIDDYDNGIDDDDTIDTPTGTVKRNYLCEMLQISD